MEMEMWNPVLAAVWRASWQSAVLVIVILTVQRLFRTRLAPRWRYALWLLVVARLLLPVSVESTLSIFNLAQVAATPAFTQTEPVATPLPSVPHKRAEHTTALMKSETPEIAMATEMTFLPTATATVTELPPATPTTYAINWRQIALWTWLAGALILGGRLAWGNLRFARKLRGLQQIEAPEVLSTFRECQEVVGVDRQLELIETNHVESPALFGCFRLRLLLPLGMTQRFSTDELRYIFLHELAHIRRGDVFVNWVMAFLQVLHWFNPLVWLGFHRMRADRELACDALALSFAEDDENRSYGETILKLLESFTRPAAVPGLVGILEDKQELAERLTMIARFRRGSRWSFLALLLISCLAFVTLTDAQTRRGDAPRKIPAAAGTVTAESSKEKRENFTTLNLLPFYDLKAAEQTQFSVWEVVPKGRQVLDGVPFQLDGMIRLFGQIPPPHGTIYRDAVPGIPVGTKFGALYLLHGTGWTTEDGTDIARVILNYRDGSKHEFTIRYGEHVRDWWKREADEPDAVSDPASKVAWKGEHSMTALRFYKTQLLNPRPGKEVKTIDIVSTRSPVTPAIVAMSVGPAQLPARPPEIDAPKPTTIGDRATIRVQVMDTATGDPIENAGIQVQFCDDKGCRYLGAFQTDKRGEKEILYPTKNLTSLSMSVSRDGYVPGSVSWPVRDGTRVPDKHTIKLKKGLRIGGVVQDEAGNPVKGAKVDLESRFSSSSQLPREVNIRSGTLVGHTDANGKWFVVGVPKNLDNITFDVSHENFVPHTYVDDEDPVQWTERGRVKRDALFAETAIFVLKAGKIVRGRVTDEEGKPIADASVNFGDSIYHANKRTTTTKENGQFELRVGEIPSGKLFILKEQFAPAVTNVNLSANEPLAITLRKGRIMKGRVVDVAGKPVAGVTIAPEEVNGHRIFNWRGTTDKEGRFTWNSAPDAPVKFAFLKNGYMELRKHELTASNEELVITLPIAPEIRGQVTDSKSGKPVTRFRLILNEDYGHGSAFQRQSKTVDDGDGKFSLKISEPASAQYALRVEAEGYMPAKSGPFKDGNVATNFNFELTPAKTLQGIVLLPDGKPAAGVQVGLVTPTSGIQLGKGRIRGSEGSKITLSGSNGAFKVLPDPEALSLIFLHEAGYAEVSTNNFNTLETVTLQPWGRIEGILKVGSKPAAKSEVLLQPKQWLHNSLGYDYTAFTVTTDDAGRFTMEKIPPGERTLYRVIPIGKGGKQFSHRTLVNVKAGEATSVQVGGTGRAIIGKLVSSNPEREVDWELGHRSLGTKQPKPPGAFKSQEEVEAWMNSDEVKRARDNFRNFGLTIAPDGTFKIEDVPAGEYSLMIHVTDPKAAQPGAGKTIGSLNRDIVVPEMPGGRSDEPLDLGELKVSIMRDLKVGSPAPDFEIKTVDGKPLKLSDFRGKYVLLDFWATWCGPCVAEMPHMKEVYDTFGKDPRFAMIGLSLDNSADAPNKFAAKHEIKWIQGYLGEWSKTQLPSEYGINGIPAVFLVDPEGKIAAKDFRGAAVKTAVAAALK